MRILKNIVGRIATASALVAVALTSSCTKDEVIARTIVVQHNDTVQHAWQAEPEFNGYDQYITTAYATGTGQVFFYGIQKKSYVYDSTLAQWTSPYGVNGAEYYLRPAVNKTFYAFVGVNNFYSITNPYNNSFLYSFGDSLKHLDGLFSSEPDYVNSPLTNIVDISDSNRFIFPAQTTNNPTKNGYYILDINQNNFYPYPVSSFHKLFLGSRNNSVVFSSINHFGNRFFVSANDSTYLVREDFSTNMVIPDAVLYSIFKYNGNYYAAGTKSAGTAGVIYETTNNGETWTLQYNLSNNNTVILNFDNNLIAINQSQLWQVSLSTTSISFKEIVNDGLTGKTITGLVKCNGKVWITTNGGVFYRPYSSFYKYK